MKRVIYLIKGHSKLIKFLIVGVTSTSIDLGFLYIFVDILKIQLFIGVVLSFLLAVINGFIWNKLWTFNDKSIKYKRQFTKFLFVSLVGLTLTLTFMYLFSIILGFYYLFAKILTSLIVVNWNFLGNKYWTFKFKNNLYDEINDFSIKYSIIIPAFNEERRLPDTLKKIDSFLKNKGDKYEILVIDDGSTDNTIKVTNDLHIDKLQIIKNKINKGKGYSVKQGILYAKGEFILFTDADNSTPIEELNKLEKYILQYDIVIGSRFCDNADIRIKQGRIRQKISRIGNKIIQYFLFDGIDDTQCGFKLFKHNVAKKLFSLQKTKGFGFDMEILLAAKTLGFKIKEVPITWFNSDYSRVRPIRDTMKTLLELIFIKINYWFEGYK